MPVVAGAEDGGGGAGAVAAQLGGGAAVGLQIKGTLGDGFGSGAGIGKAGELHIAEFVGHFAHLDIAHGDGGALGDVADLQQQLQLTLALGGDGVGHGLVGGAEPFHAEALFIAAGQVLEADRAAVGVGDVQAHLVALSRLQLGVGLDVELHVPVRAGRGDGSGGAAAFAGERGVGAGIGLQEEGIGIGDGAGQDAGDNRLALGDLHVADLHGGAGGDVADLQQDLQSAVRLGGDGVGHGAVGDGLGAEALLALAGGVLIADGAAGGAGDVKADLVGLAGLQLIAGLGIELHVPVVAGLGDGGGGAAAVAGELTQGALIGLQVKGVLGGTGGGDAGVTEARQVHGDKAGVGLFDLHIAHGDGGAGGDVADLQQDLQGAALLRGDGVGHGAVRDGLGAEAVFGAGGGVFVAGGAAGGAGHVHADGVGLAGLQLVLGLGVELHVPVVAGRGDGGGGAAAVAGELSVGAGVCLQEEGVGLGLALFPHGIGKVGKRDLLGLALGELGDADVGEGHVVAGGAVGLAQLQAQGQRTVALVGGDGVFHVVRAAGGEAAAVERAVGVLIVAVEAGLVLGLVRGGADVKFDLVGGAGVQGHAGGGIELGLPDASALGGGLQDLQGRAGGALFQLHHIVAVMALIDRVGPLVREGGGQGQLLVGGGDQGLEGLAGGNLLVQGEVLGKHVLVVVDDLVHVKVFHLHRGALGHHAQGELQHQLVPIAAADDHGLHGFGLLAGQALAVKGAVALFHLVVVEEELKGHVLVAGHVRGDAVAHACLGDQAGVDVEPGLPDARIPGGGQVFDADLVGASGEHRGIALVMPLIDQQLLLEIHRRLQGVLIVHLVGELLHLDLGKVDGEGGQHAQLQIQIAGAAAGDHHAGDAVLTLLDVKLLEVAELDLAGHVGVEAVGHPIVPAGNGGVIALQLHMPGFPVGLRGGKAIDAVYLLALAGNRAAFKLGVEHGGFQLGGGQISAAGDPGRSRGSLRCRGARLQSRNAQQHGDQKQHSKDCSCSFHGQILLIASGFVCICEKADYKM